MILHLYLSWQKVFHVKLLGNIPSKYLAIVYVLLSLLAHKKHHKKYHCKQRKHDHWKSWKEYLQNIKRYDFKGIFFTANQSRQQLNPRNIPQLQKLVKHIRVGRFVFYIYFVSQLSGILFIIIFKWAADNHYFLVVKYVSYFICVRTACVARYG